MAKGDMTWGDERSMEPTHTSAGTSGGGTGNGAHQDNKGTERPCRDVTYGADVGENVPGAPDFRSMPAIMHEHGPYGVEANTNPGKGRAIRPTDAHIGDTGTIAETPRTTS
jgi:hypothetical protein